jgi:hypothetical protein
MNNRANLKNYKRKILPTYIHSYLKNIDHFLQCMGALIQVVAPSDLEFLRADYLGSHSITST